MAISRRAPDGSFLPGSLCPMPWINLSLDVDGTSRPCCKFAHIEADSPYQMANLRDHDLDQVWNSPAMQRLRADFRAGERPHECATCWDEEASGVASWRQTFLHDRGVQADIDFDETAPDHPVTLDLKLSNACNLKCRICGPIASSLWLHEELQLGEAHNLEYLKANRSTLRANKVTRNEANLATLEAWIPHLQHVEMTGGEPMFSTENREVIDTIVRGGHAAGTTLLLTTNATVIDDRIIDQLCHFAGATITLSIDDIGDRFTYERSPATWDVLERNLTTYMGMVGPRCTVRINCSVSTVNVWYLPEMLEWWLRRDPDRLAPLNLNLVHGPAHYDVRNLPDPMKREVRGRLLRARRNRALPSMLRREVSSLCDFMTSTPPDPWAWAEFGRVTAERDTMRDESFAATFPELFAFLEVHHLWPAPGRQVASVDLPRRRLRR